ncbi:transglycosylase SLT domain-containing protein [Streptomyces sp. NBC_00059]|uniref:transglycosylase SLT domain-containing protein n=1 Tax=Streptomyces sp. NBC_00059 TaxID=2975635 RepID=UPI0022568B4A|nr:transglycosylase SLT domain-containing protein [Streptomyces sp. NBC_00059]MCX5414995.1 transglycosylase SLT domain-containing protein [Streptomyces sp. NBC_00059]
MNAITRRPAIRKSAVAALATAGAAAVTLTLVPSPAHAAEPAKASTAQTKAQTDKIKAIVKVGEKKYGDDLNGWIRTALDVMDAKNIPGSYEGLHRNIMRESSGNPKAQNNWDVNAQNGIPSKGLLQTIQPTFDYYHVKGTKDSITDPVANIVAACNYAADKYGSMDNVDSAY